MDCREARIELAAGSSASPEPALREHLDGCPDCRAYAGDLDRLTAALPTTCARIETPPRLRLRTLAACRDLLPAGPARAPEREPETVLVRWRRLCASPAFIVASAIVAGVLLIVLAVIESGGGRNETLALVLKLVIGQIIVQNLLATLVLPALLLGRGGPQPTPSIATGE